MTYLLRNSIELNGSDISNYKYVFFEGPVSIFTVVPTESDSDVMFCLQSYQGLIIDRSLVY